MLAACSNEKRTVGADLPRTPPTGAGDQRIEHYQDNAFQISQGSRYYLWYGCGGCHASGSGAGPDLAKGRWRGGEAFNAVYASIAHGHAHSPGDYEGLIPVEQLWEITAYVRSLPSLDPQQHRRQDIDTYAEPHDRHGPGAP
jgi:cytochrome c oxidase cbb3-type subunit 3